MWSNLFNTPAHLTSFLRLFADSFHIQSNLVTLLQAPKVSQKHITAQIPAATTKSSKDSKNNKEKAVKVEEKAQSNQEVKNAKNLEIVNSKTENIASEYIEKTAALTLSPKSSISDRLNKPKMQQKLSESQKSKSPEPEVKLPSEDVVDNKAKGVNFKLGNLYYNNFPYFQFLD